MLFSVSAIFLTLIASAAEGPVRGGCSLGSEVRELRYGRMASPEEIEGYGLREVYELLGMLDLDRVVKVGAEKQVLKAINEETLTEAAVFQAATALALSDLGIRDFRAISKFLRELPRRDRAQRVRFVASVRNHAQHLLGLDLQADEAKALAKRDRELRGFYSPLQTDVNSMRARWEGREARLGGEADRFVGYLVDSATQGSDDWSTLLSLEIGAAQKGRIRSTVAHKMEFLAWAATETRPAVAPEGLSGDLLPRTRVREGIVSSRHLFVRNDIHDAVRGIRNRERVVAGVVGSFLGGVGYVESLGHGLSSLTQAGGVLATTALGYAVVGFSTARKDMSWIVSFLRSLPGEYSVDDIRYFIDGLPPTYRFAAKLNEIELQYGVAKIDSLSHLSLLAMAERLGAPPSLSDLSWMLRKLRTSTNRKILVRSLQKRFPGVHFESMLAALRDRRGKDWLRVLDGSRIRYFPREVVTEGHRDPSNSPRFRVAPELERPLDLTESEFDEWEREFLAAGENP